MRIAANADRGSVISLTFNAVYAPPSSGNDSTVNARLTPVELPEISLPGRDRVAPQRL